MTEEGEPICKRAKEFNSNLIDVEVYLIPHKIQKRRYEILLEKSKEKGLPVVTELRPDAVTHVVSEYSTIELAAKAIHCDAKMWSNTGVAVLSTSWLSECIKSGQLVDIQPCHRLPPGELNATDPLESSDATSSAMVPEWACQRITRLNHCNSKFTQALQILEEYAAMKEEGNNVRGLAFRRAASTLASLSTPITRSQQLIGLPDIGEHCRRVIEDILENGSSAEVDMIENDTWFKKMKMFTSVFGVGPATARRWISSGLSSIEDALLIVDSLAKDDPRIVVGLTHFKDLSCTPVLRQEADAVHDLISSIAESFVPGTTAELVGGFRRGKVEGHDIDLLITHPVEGKEAGLLAQIVSRLDQSGMVIYGRQERNTYSEEDAAIEPSHSRSSIMDHFEKWIGVLRVDANAITNSGLASIRESEEAAGRTWKARRVDLIIVPRSQYAYALVGWTGNKHFNRSLRLYAQRQLNYRLNSHGLYDISSKQSFPASTEQDIFIHLKLEYREPSERNC